MNVAHTLLRHAFTLGLALSANLALATGQYALTLYDEPPKYPADFTHFDYVNPDAPKGGTLRIADIGGFDSLNPWVDKGVPAAQVQYIYDTLMVQSLDEPMTEYGLVAERAEKAPDNTWVRFYLRPQARFQDGHPLRAEDVTFTFDTLIKYGAPFWRSYWADVQRVEVENPLQVVFYFKNGNNRELPMIIGQLPVLPKHFWQGKDFARASLDVPLGSGPYRVASVQAGRSLRLERDANYWAKDLPVNRGQYNFDAIVADVYRDAGVAIEALKAGAIDWRQEMVAKNWASAYDTPALREGKLIKEEIPNGSPNGMQGFAFNQRRSLFQDVRVREALSLMLDFEWTNRQLFNNAYVRASSYFSNSELAATGLPDADELKLLEPLRGKIPDRVFSEPYRNPVSDGSGVIRDQQRRAYQLLQEAGWKVADDRMTDANGKPVSIEFLVAFPEYERILLPYKRNLKDLGIDLVLRRVDASQYVNRMRARDFDMAITSLPQSPSPGNEQRNYFTSDAADRPGTQNVMGLKDPAVDQLVDGLINAGSRKSLITHARALDRVLLWNFVLIPNWTSATWRVAYWNRLQHPGRPPKYDIGLMTWWARPGATELPHPAADAAAEGAR
ncbi:extracellular solute-binding protein [Pseudomonas typographi]|uniref:ABC transporter substrate-binding protein n=1 Tax=Pseudomonas typographi TaxID=2715964 RepID=A0ABR7Z0S4_9PSED|nr:extracellular solute-binding protein [Pseudomonas typographi]MBD1599043.1 ABC transporter substrate-binding protein [Pseudomonas typographi]